MSFETYGDRRFQYKKDLLLLKRIFFFYITVSSWNVALLNESTILLSILFILGFNELSFSSSD